MTARPMKAARFIPVLFLALSGAGLASAQTKVQAPPSDPAARNLAGVAAAKGVINPGQPSLITGNHAVGSAARAPLDARIEADEHRMSELMNYKFAKGNARILSIKPALGG